MTFNEILSKYRKIAFSERDKGERFERLMAAYLQTDPNYGDQLNTVWMWNDFPFRDDFGGTDTGIDLVAKTNNNEYWAIQCKFFDESAYIDKASVDSFLATSGRSFRNEQLKTVSFSQRLWISTTNKWSVNAENALKNQNPPAFRLNLSALEEAPVDWDKINKGLIGKIARKSKKQLRNHQIEALVKTEDYFKNNDRGKLIMACGTGKTFTALKISEKVTAGKGFVLVLVPSIALIGQMLREWTGDAEKSINAICICSDPKVSKHKKSNKEGSAVIDLAQPASTDPEYVKHQLIGFNNYDSPRMTVVFSTYQSIEVISKVQKAIINANIGYDAFDLIICDEAHRTTGVTLSGEDESAFVKVHDNDFIRAKKRLYMTATPRLYSDDSKSKAAISDAVLCSMDDEKLYGKEIYRIGFGEAVERDLLTDYKVLILTLNDNDISPVVQSALSAGSELSTDDATKLVGVINALSKQVLGDNGLLKNSDPEPMKRAVAFCQNIKISKKTTSVFNNASESYLETIDERRRKKMVQASSKHIDGTMSATERDDLLSWLKSNDTESDECRILTNVRCLSEGVDVPSLDAVAFLSARNSQVDVVQSVGRVMRKAPGKKYGYIIIPVVIPSNIPPSQALNDNQRFKVVWTVLNALRAHDDRFNATVNKIELNKKKPDQILVGGITSDNENVSDNENIEISRQLMLQFEELQGVVYAKMVEKVGDRFYWEQWAKDVAVIAENQIERINTLIDNCPEHKDTFSDFLNGLQKNINPGISHKQTVEMLAQHIITRPIFESLFENYSFAKNNAISQSMQNMLDMLEGNTLEGESETLQKFYNSVRKRAEGIDNAEGKQRIIIELYDKFFKTAFPKMVEQLGIVYTPVEVVDFIIHSVDNILRKEFDRRLTDEYVHILDPFTGTGTFITRLLQSGLIDSGDLKRKYSKELHANEIVLLAYYIAAVNIENTFHDLLEENAAYKPFDGIVLTDTFQMGEDEEKDDCRTTMFPKNSERVEAQKQTPIKIIIGNPPYSVGQKSANDNAQNLSYKKLDRRVADTYAKDSKATSVKALYDAYIKAFRWAADRLDKDGIICFVSNGAWITTNGMDGFRKSLQKEFSSIYVFDLRGNQRTSGEMSRKEGGKIFGSGSRTQVSVTLLVKNSKSNKNAEIFYCDIGDYLNRNEKLSLLRKYKSVTSEEMKWRKLKPNKHGDWLNQRNDVFSNYLPMAPDKKFSTNSKSFFVVNSMGVNTSRDVWVYNFSSKSVRNNMEKMVRNYNEEVKRFKKAKAYNPALEAKTFVDNNPEYISWSSSLLPNVDRGNFAEYEPERVIKSIYRPFVKQNLYMGDKMIHRRGQMEQVFQDYKEKNVVISIHSSSSAKEFSCLVSDIMMDLHYVGDTQCFPLYYFEEKNEMQNTLFDIGGNSKYKRLDGVSDFILKQAVKLYGKRVTKENIFYYVYGILHSRDYRAAFANDLKKMLPRIPLVERPKDFWAFCRAGEKLADLHLNYESVPAAPGLLIIVDGQTEQMNEVRLNTGKEDHVNFHVTKMRFPKKGERDKIIYNSLLTVENIPEKAYEYQVNGKSAIEWIMERYQIKTDKKSGITNDPNDWAEETGNPRYILDLLLSVINVSIQTVDIVNNLPALEFDV